MQSVAETAQGLSGQWQFLWDLRNVGEEVYRDTLDAFAGVWATLPDSTTPKLLVAPRRRREIVAAFRPFTVEAVEMHPKAVRNTDLDLRPFDNREEIESPEDPGYRFGQLVTEKTPIDAAIKTLVGKRPWTPLVDELTTDHRLKLLAHGDPFGLGKELERRYQLDLALRSAATNSVLTQLSLHEQNGHIHVIPYHGGSLHEVMTGDGMAVLMRPARVNQRYWSTFPRALGRLEELINSPGVAEREIEALLVENPFLLGSLGYTEIYHQVVLPRDGAADLRPDVIAEPVGSAWAEIIDLKLPTERIVVGRNDRVAQAAGLTEAAAQLREYATYFDDRAAAAKIEANFGFRCYKPKLTVVVGRDPNRFTADEQRRALTAHPDLRVVSYDDLLRAAQHRLML